MRSKIRACPFVFVAFTATSPGLAQVALDRADPTITQRASPRAIPPTETAPLPTEVARVARTIRRVSSVPRIASAIVIDGNAEIATTAFASALVPFIGRDLSGHDLSQLAGAVAGVARDFGYPFASATIEPQSMADDILHVRLDEGRISAVRIIGVSNPLADRVLTKALVTGRAVDRATLERAIMLVGDIPGMTVKDSKYVRQDGFGILLVNGTEDRASAYAQIDNRGTREVGPMRSTLLASVRNLAQSGDEIGLIAAFTPLQPKEFAFLRARYSAPVDLDGAVATVSGAYGRANPGASLAPLDVVGNSIDLAVSYARPLIRSRSRSLWANLEFRALKSDQTLLGTKLRDDRLAMLTGSLNGATRVGKGVLRGEVAMLAGLPFSGVSHQGDAMTSRADGDARFVAWNYTADWTADLGGPFAIMLASSGQLASRPLLATIEVGAGGPAFGRAYDYAERTGDQGILGSAEVRADLGALSDVITRFQLYGFIDGGYVDNLRGGVGGGSLLSTGAGARFGHGGLDGMVEVALPLNADRFDTGTKRPRISFRISRGF
jgi:hemolysin activation/secretion protein